MIEIELSGLDGSNPLGFLAALGVLRTLQGSGSPPPRLGWNRESLRPVLACQAVASPDALVDALARCLARTQGETAARAAAAKKAFEDARTRARKARDDIKRRKLSREAARAAFETEWRPLDEEASRLRSEWRGQLARSAPDPVVALGANLNVWDSEFRSFCREAAEAVSAGTRAWADFCAALGCEHGADDDKARMRATPLALVSGSGHQDFLGSVEQLMTRCTVEHVREAVFGPWRYADQKYSLRWDPIEDRRYALLAGDPTASDSKPTTVWGANRLAFEGLPLFPCSPTLRGMRTVGLTRGETRTLRWPLWAGRLSLDVVRSLLALDDVLRDDAQGARRLRARGVFAVFGCQRIAVGSGSNRKFNFTPAVPVWS